MGNGTGVYRCPETTKIFTEGPGSAHTPQKMHQGDASFETRPAGR